MLSEKGSLRETSVMKLLLTLFEQGLTGILYLKDDDVLKVLYFNRGKLIWAISNSDDDKLENILIARDMVEIDTLNKIKREAHVSDSIGKLLVGKGLITLEELIDISKAQLKRIIRSVLKWKDGGFQFVKDTPPERLLSLDLSITDFIIDFILDEMDISDIWKEIGSLQVELIKNPDEKKLARYHLSDKQLELLNNFSGENKLEEILNRHSGGHRESLLKIIYFFLISELLIKKEFELNDSSAFEENTGFDYSDTDAGPFDNRLDSLGGDTFSPRKIPSEQTYTLGSIMDDTGDEPTPPTQPTQPTQPRKPEQRLSPPSFMMEEKTRDIKKIKMINVILVILIPIIAGIILLYLAGLFSEDPIKNMMKTDGTASENGDIISIEEKTPGTGSTKEEGAEPDTPAAVKNGEITKPDKPEEKPVEKVEEKAIVPQKVPVREIKKEDKPKLPTGKSPIAYFHEGNMITAADIWKRELKRAGVRYSILLELDCLKESVLNAYERLELKSDFFILPRPSRGRTCFLVMWGKYRSHPDAANGLKAIPQYFWQQQNPPEVLEITKYL